MSEKFSSGTINPKKQTNKHVSMQDDYVFMQLKVRHSSNFLYHGFAAKYFLGIYLHSKPWNQKETLWSMCTSISHDPMKLTFFALKFDFCVILFNPNWYFTIFLVTNMLFYSMQKSAVEILIKIVPNNALKIFKWPFALKKCGTFFLHIENLICYLINTGIKH